jgi:hypothetical protein
VIVWRDILMPKIIILVCLVVKNVKGVSWNKIFVHYAMMNFIYKFMVQKIRPVFLALLLATAAPMLSIVLLVLKGFFIMKRRRDV